MLHECQGLLFGAREHFEGVRNRFLNARSVSWVPVRISWAIERYS